MTTLTTLNTFWDLLLLRSFNVQLILYIQVANASPSPCVAASFGGFVRNIKRRDTSFYQLATAGNKQIMLWSIDPIKGEMECSKVAAEGRGSQVRNFTCIAFSPDYELLYAGTSSGDYIISNVKTKSMMTTVPAARQGIHSLLTSPHGLLVGGGDGTVTLFDAHSMHDVNQVWNSQRQLCKKAKTHTHTFPCLFQTST